MRALILSVFLICPSLPAVSGQCGSIVPSVCTLPAEEAPTRKVLRVKPTVTPFVVGDRFPTETRSLLMDPTRYDLAPSDGSWRYYAMSGVVYRVDAASSLVLEVIRDHRTSNLR
jgi:hypothetical protein